MATTGGIAAPLLAGFSLTAVIQLATASPSGAVRRTEVAILLFAAAAVLLVYCVQFSALALGFRASPSDRLSYYPETVDDPAIRTRVRDHQWEETSLWSTYSLRAGVCYDLGLLAFLAGLGVLLIPRGHWPWERIVALAFVGVAVVLEMIWALSGAKRPKWLLPTFRAKGSTDPPYGPPPPPLSDSRWTALFGPDPRLDEINDQLSQLAMAIHHLGAVLEQMPQVKEAPSEE